MGDLETERPSMLGDVGHLGASTKPADQTLGNHQPHRVANRIVGDAHVDEAVDGVGAIAGVEGRHDQLAGERRLQRNLGGRAVAHLADENHFGVEAEQAAEAGRHVESGSKVDLRLGHAVDRDFNRIFERGDAPSAAAGGDNLAQAGISRGGFAAAGRADDEHRPRGCRQIPVAAPTGRHPASRAAAIAASESSPEPSIRSTARSPKSVGNVLTRTSTCSTLVENPPFLRQRGLVREESRQHL